MEQPEPSPIPSEGNRSRIFRALIGLSIATYFGLATFQITLPGPYYDEALHAPAAIALVTQNGDKFGYGVTAGGWRLPVMTGEYLGALKSYAFLPLFFLFGPDTLTLRLTTILITVLGLYFTARFAKSAFGWGPAVVGTWLIATDPTFILATRSDWGPVAIAFTLRMSVLHFGWRWWNSRGTDRAALLATSVLLGLGLWDKANFVWFVAALLVSVGVAFVFTRERPRISASMLILTTLGFALAAGPLIAYNVSANWITFKLAVLPGEQASIAKLISLVPVRTVALRATFDPRALRTG